MAAEEPAIATVIRKQFCVGCGACSAIDPRFKVRPAANGELRVLDVPDDPESLARADRVCPFGSAPDEDTIARAAFPDAAGYTDGIGRYVDLYAGWAEEHRAAAGSGGLTRWLMAELLESGEVDYVVQVDYRSDDAPPGQPLFSYAIHENAAASLKHAASSAYHPVTLQRILDEIAGRPGRCAVTALPCFSRALRAVIGERPELGERVRFISGVICGSLKSRRYAEYLTRQLGVMPAELGRINYRGKSLSRVASEKCVEVWRQDSANERPDGVARVQDLSGTSYDLGYFKYKGCDWCDDVLAETADIAFGDAWFSPYNKDPRGTNIVVVRNSDLARLLRSAALRGAIRLDHISAEQVLKSQRGGLRHRRDGLAFRLAIARTFRRWTPKKRVAPRWGGPVAFAVQTRRVGIRALTRAPRLAATGRAMPAAVWVILRFTRIMEWGAGIGQRVARRAGIKRKTTSIAARPQGANEDADGAGFRKQPPDS